MSSKWPRIFWNLTPKFLETKRVLVAQKWKGRFNRVLENMETIVLIKNEFQQVSCAGNGGYMAPQFSTVLPSVFAF